ncbi:T9SS type A sorting domain-containing protein [Hymenobacter sp. CRA2]|uniref:T9SS type A sorting domain-containing protein n=1 Tax=Hymenobacter sp. CRA2 TaxID=1955620 RepID=UPI0009C66E45|nr:T9SS type A sorting domain-containing protein [Hymenobacter sp. CRA2]OON67186.1 hypothetical protein B0919_18840 [Hymenobacter sp. CRA2]
MSADPARTQPGTAAGAARTAALGLPFFEDFAGQREGSPNAARWETNGGVLVNERFSLGPPSRGMATFDGLNGRGQSYGPPAAYSNTDTLTSLPIDLSGGQPTDRTYLSFFWQAGSIVGAPSANSSSRRVNLQLEFLDNTGAWNSVWDQNSQGIRTDFKQEFIAVDQAKYLHAGFRFRFRASGSQFGTRDTWNLDYILLDRNRATTNVSYADVVLSAPLSSLLKRYAAMPSWQFNAAPNPTQELNDSTFSTFNNLDVGAVPPTPFQYQGSVQVLPAGNVVTSATVTPSPPPAPGTRQLYVGYSVRALPVAIPAGPSRVRHNLYLSLLNAPTDPRRAPNDTVRRITEFSNYFAYDDGTAEGTNNLRQSEVRATSRAIRFELNRPDQIDSLRYYYAGATAASGVPVPPSVTITFAVWEVGPDGLPAAQPKATKSVNLPTTVTSPGYRGVKFDRPVSVSGRFFIGYLQPVTPLFVQFGADLNSRQPRDTFYDNETGAWVPFGNRSFVPMLRPYMSGVVSSAHNAAANAALRVYPNPTQGLLQVSGARYSRAVALDALGRTVWEQPAAEAGKSQLDLRTLRAGVYLLRFTLPDGSVSTQRLVLQP